MIVKLFVLTLIAKILRDGITSSHGIKKCTNRQQNGSSAFLKLVSILINNISGNVFCFSDYCTNK